jgi:RNA polymerase sigma factor (sigma-70 family)
MDVLLDTNNREPSHDAGRSSELYEIHGRAIFSYLRVQGLALEDAEDLLIEIFLAAFEQEHLAAFSQEKQLAWLRGVAYHKLMNTYRHKRRHPQIPLDSMTELHLEAGPEQLMLLHEEISQLHAYVQQLPVLHQQVLQLRYSNGLAHAEIAILLKKREAAVRKILSRAILALRRMYQKTEGE